MRMLTAAILAAAATLLLAIAPDMAQARQHPAGARGADHGARHSRAVHHRAHRQRLRHGRRVYARRGVRRRAAGPSQVVRLQQQVDTLRRELAEFREKIWGKAPPLPGPQAVEPSLSVPAAPALASLPDVRESPLPAPRRIPPMGHVQPANAVQRGQFRDQRPTHRHAGLDLAGECGSPIVASYAGVVQPAPGGDRGYGPIVRVIHGDDGRAYRYAHMSSVRVRIGQRVATGEQIGNMGKAGGLCHLHFEVMDWAEYRRRPYGVHALAPNDLIGGRRGSRMSAGEAMSGARLAGERVLAPTADAAKK